MNQMVWLPEEHWYMAKPKYKEGSLTATVVTFVKGKVRVVQAACNPSETHPTLTLTLSATYNLGKDNYDKKVAFDILKWIFSPDNDHETWLVLIQSYKLSYHGAMQHGDVLSVFHMSYIS
ncbi:hypothetical protein AJ78_04539 [Emergomyces pasteurianus Ep9510]|uniref:Uncharacterized protein n=1 Tax=Emergomyces pasteurianus Ep9510 TaxID=1447872 RepID=A0A1J9PFE7_9EURO|nr:hypothetical protein AJ78_04539 [Emergomyces pasteurianus Ep9510]